MVPKSKIEERSILVLEKIISDHPTMESHINKGDKEMSWDGYIRIFQDDNKSLDKKNFDDDIPVQVKGHIDKSGLIKKSYISHQVSLDDLKIFYREKGCLYFEIYISEDNNESAIFYSSLYPSKIKEYIRRADKKDNKKCISIPFIKLENDYRDLYRICKQFSVETRKQGSGLGQIVSRNFDLDDLKKISKISATNICESGNYNYTKSFVKNVNKGDVVLYGSFDNNYIEFPLLVDEMSCVETSKYRANISIGSKIYYSEFDCYYSIIEQNKKPGINEIVKIKPSENIELEFKNSSLTLTFHLKTCISQLKSDAEFILNLINEKAVLIDNTIFNCTDIQCEDITYLKRIIDYENILEEIGLELNIPFEQLSDADKIELNRLLYFKNEFEPGKKNIFKYVCTFEEKKWPILIDTTGKNNTLYSSIFNDHFRIFLKPGSDIDIPKFAVVSTSVFSNLIYYDFKSISSQVETVTLNDDMFSVVNYMLLQLITAYDSTGITEFLGVSEKLGIRMTQSFPDEIEPYINLGQVEYRREGHLSENTIAKLNELYYKYKEGCLNGNIKSEQDLLLRDLDYKEFCICVLKNQLEKADMLFDKMSQEDKDMIRQQPIIRLYISLKHNNNSKKGNE